MGLENGIQPVILEFERAELLIDNLPDDLVRRHGEKSSRTIREFRSEPVRNSTLTYSKL